MRSCTDTWKPTGCDSAEQLGQQMVQVFPPVAPFMAAVGFHILVLVSVLVKQLTVFHIVLIQEIPVANGNEIQLGSLCKLGSQFSSRFSKYTHSHF